MAYDQDLSFVYFGPTKIIFGNGSSTSELDSEMSAMGCSRAVIVTDPGIIKVGLLDKITKSLGGKCVGVFSDVPQDSGLDVIDRAAAFAREKGADIIISVGGGSAIDTAKGMCILLTEGGSLADFEGIQQLTRLQTPHIVIPTTAGTGSEVTWIAVVYDKSKGQKRLIVETYNAPRVAILDPTLTAKLPPLLTASTGMDALTHAVEAISDVDHEPIADALGLHAIRLLNKYLPACIKNGSDLTARGQVQLAATMAGWAFGNSMVGLVHAMAHSIGAVAHVPHGVANGILLPHCMEFNLPDAEDYYAEIAQAMGVYEKGSTTKQAAETAVKAVFDFSKKIGHPQKLSEFGVTEEDIIKAADMSMSDGAIVCNVRLVDDSSEVLAIYRKAL
ncbi:MAG: NAD-dependent alcohol dehydrogenase [Deltaproteobacteria bacterium HGW-Deltaproteobacteria-9]|nr:MAG: NAD-dependent alcohol dehydrogenase [Deltaproteobacteria bacterium HGW-Deltaproteobacteria-9]